MGEHIKRKNEYDKHDPTAYNAIKEVESPQGDLDDWNQEGDGKSKIYVGSKKYLEVESHKKIKQNELIEQAELKIGKTIDRKTLREWEEYGLFARGEKIGRCKEYNEKAIYELHASWLLVNGPPIIEKNKYCSYRKAGEIRRMVIEAQRRFMESKNENDFKKIMTPFGTVNIDENNPNPDYFEEMKDPLIENHNLALAHFWLRYRSLSEKGFDPLDDSKLMMFMKKESAYCRDSSSSKQYNYVVDVK